MSAVLISSCDPGYFLTSWPWMTLMDPDWPWALRVYLFLPLSLFNLHWLDPPWMTMSAVCCEDFFPFYILTLTDPSWPWLTLTLTDDGHFAQCWFLSFLLPWPCQTDWPWLAMEAVCRVGYFVTLLIQNAVCCVGYFLPWLMPNAVYCVGYFVTLASHGCCVLCWLFCDPGWCQMLCTVLVILWPWLAMDVVCCVGYFVTLASHGCCCAVLVILWPWLMPNAVYCVGLFCDPGWCQMLCTVLVILWPWLMPNAVYCVGLFCDPG